MFFFRIICEVLKCVVLEYPHGIGKTVATFKTAENVQLFHRFYIQLKLNIFTCNDWPGCLPPAGAIAPSMSWVMAIIFCNTLCKYGAFRPISSSYECFVPNKKGYLITPKLCRAVSTSWITSSILNELLKVEHPGAPEERERPLANHTPVTSVPSLP